MPFSFQISFIFPPPRFSNPLRRLLVTVANDSRVLVIHAKSPFCSGCFPLTAALEDQQLRINAAISQRRAEQQDKGGWGWEWAWGGASGPSPIEAPNGAHILYICDMTGCNFDWSSHLRLLCCSADLLTSIPGSSAQSQARRSGKYYK